MALTAKKVYAILKRQISDMEAKLNSPVRYRGTVATADLLPLNPDIGDMYNIESKSVYGEAGMNVAWNGVVWDTMGAPIDMSLYIKSSELADWVKQQNKPAYTAEEVGALPADTKIPSKTSELKNDSGFLTKVPDSYLNGTDTTLKESGKAADAKATGDKFTEISADISKKLDKNQGSENSGKIAGINESGDIVPMFPVGVEYNEETNCLEFGSDQGMKLNQGIGLDSTLTKTGFAADAGVTGKEIASLKEDISTKITKFYASNQGNINLQDSDNGKIMDMMLYGKSEQKQYSGKNLLNATLQTTTLNGITCTNNGDGTYTINGTTTKDFGINLAAGLTNIVFDTSIYLLGLSTSSPSAVYLSAGFTEGPDVVTDKSNTVKEIKSTNSGKLFKIYLWIGKNVTISNLVVKPMLTTDLTATYDDFEPYTGGIPSPNPDYPQEIKSVVNPTVKVCGKNLLNVSGNAEINGNITFHVNGDTMTLIAPKGVADYQWVQFEINPSQIVGKKIILSYKNLTQTNQAGNATTYIKVWYADGRQAFVQSVTVSSDVTRIVVRILANSGTTALSEENKVTIIGLMVNVGDSVMSWSEYHEQTVTLPYDLYGVKVPSGGNVTIDGKEYIADYVDVERGKLVGMVLKRVFNGTEKWRMTNSEKYNYFALTTSDDSKLQSILPNNKNIRCNLFKAGELNENNILRLGDYERVQIRCDSANTVEEFKNMLSAKNAVCYFVLKTPSQIDLTPEEVQALKALATYYPTTNISVNSEQLDGYTVFNYPVSMENGWNYVKKQLNDNRDYIYDIDSRTQDTDLQAAEAYVNSEYAVALTELEA